MADEEESPVPPVAPSLESRSSRKKMPSTAGIRGGRGRGRGSAPATVKPTAPSAPISTDTQLETLAEDGDHAEKFDMNAEISVSVPTDDEADDEADASQLEGEDAASVPSNPSKATRGRKGKRAGVHVSPSKIKVKRAKRAGCWKYFKQIEVPSEKEFGVMVTMAKCRFCHKSYVYQQGGATSQLNRHLNKCSPFQNKLALRFPVVSTMAKKFLAVPASSVSSESTFSCGGRVLDDYRSSLKPATVQALVCASSWIRGSKSPPIILGEDDDADIEAVELPSSVVESN